MSLKKSDDSATAEYWRGRGGTPLAIDPYLAPIAITPLMRLWLRINDELVGGLDDSGCYPRPESLACVLRWYRGPILVWMDSVSGGQLAEDTAMRLARELLRCLGSGRAEAQSEDFDDDD